jgi:hypothetical protein
MPFNEWYSLFTDDIEGLLDDMIDFVESLVDGIDTIKILPDIRDGLIKYIYFHSQNSYPRMLHLYLE